MREFKVELTVLEVDGKRYISVDSLLVILGILPDVPPPPPKGTPVANILPDVPPKK
jgi:hypothetical protein